MKPHIHAKNSALKFGGVPSNYIDIHNFMDSSKAIVPDMRHRAVFHSAFGCFIVEKVFGITITNSDGNQVSTRDIAEEHILEDLGYIPTLQDWLNEMKFQDWMMSPELRKKNEIEKKESIASISKDFNTDTLVGLPNDLTTMVLDGKKSADYWMTVAGTEKTEESEKSEESEEIKKPNFYPGRKVLDGNRGNGRGRTID